LLKNLFVLLLVCISSGTVSAQMLPIYRSLPDDVEVQKNLIYAEYEDYSLQLDLYRPTGSEKLSAIVVITGGGKVHASKGIEAAMATMLAAKGFVTVSIEYRGSDEEVFPASVHDTKAAIRWLRANAETYNIKLDAIGAIGGSWGGFLSVYSGLTNGLPELEGEGGNGDWSSDLAAVVGLSTPTDFIKLESKAENYFGESYQSEPGLWEFASPLIHVNQNSPPLLLIASATDDTIPHEHSLDMAQSYAKEGLEIEFLLLPGGGHAFYYTNSGFDETVDRAAYFFHKHLDNP
jgi:arylsulfatase A